MTPSAELHLHTCYSFLDGASSPQELAVAAARRGYRALAITDHDGLHGAMEFAQACAAAGVRPITGAELTLRHGLVDRAGGPYHLTLLAENERGYANLCRLLTEAHRHTRVDREPSPPALDPAFLRGHTEGLIALSGCREAGEASRLVDARRLDDAEAGLAALAALFGAANVWVELQNNLVKGDTRRMAVLAQLAARHGLPVVATGGVHYHERSRARLHDALVALHHRTTLEGSHRLRRPNSRFYLRSPLEVRAAFAQHPDAVANVDVVAERCRAFDLADRRGFGYDFPDFTRTEGEREGTADEVLAIYCRRRFAERYPDRATPPDVLRKARSQLDEELGLIARHHLSGFFLIYRDLQLLATDVAREVRGKGSVRNASGLPPGRGRGSSVASIVCYLIGLSHVDPVRAKLFSKRFLNEDLGAIPDIDLDFARDIREQLILRVYERWGHEHAGLVCTFATYRLRSAVRDLGKVLGLPHAAVDKLARLSEGGRAGSLREELRKIPEFQGQADGPLWRHLEDLCTQIEGLPRHVSQHPGGMVISSRPLLEMVPIQPADMDGRYLIQWDKDSVDDARMIKIDFLALGMLSLVEECLEWIWHNRGQQLDLSTIPYDDPTIYDQIGQGDTVGLFQVESRAQIQMLTRTRPRTLEDLAVQVALVRPGPIVGGAVNPYVERRERMLRDPTYTPRADHPLIDDILADTLGIIVYQDQVMEVAGRLGGFTPGQADQFRRAMSRKRSKDAMEAFRTAFLRGAKQRSVDEATAERIFDKLAAFSEFGFNKAHSSAFAVLVYQSAWLRYRYPAEFYASLFNNQPMGFYAPHVLVGDARRHGVQVLRPSINASAARAVPGDESVLLGLTTARGVSEEVAAAIVAEREAHGAYLALGDLLRRTGIPRQAAEHLIAVGAMGEFGLGRRELLWQLGLLVPSTDGKVSKRLTRRPQLSLGLPVDQDMVTLEDMTTWERMVADYGLLGLSPSYHPLALLRPNLPADLWTAKRLRAEGRDGQQVRVAGLVVCRQRPGTANGVVFLLLEDETGLANVVVWPGLYERQRSVVRGEPYLLVEGRLQLRSGTLNVLAERFTPIARALTAAQAPTEQQSARSMRWGQVSAERPKARLFH